LKLEQAPKEVKEIQWRSRVCLGASSENSIGISLPAGGQKTLEMMQHRISMKTKKDYRWIIVSLLVMAVALFFPCPARSETVALPITLDYPILRALVIKTFYTDPGPSAILVDKGNGCERVIISEPRFLRKDAFVLFETKVFIRAGLPVKRTCIMPIEWEGYVTFIQRPKIDSRWVLSFDTVESTVYDKNRKRAKLAGLIWGHLEKTVFEYIKGISIDLAPPVSEVQLFLQAVFPEDLYDRVQKMIESMRPGDLQITSEALRVDLLTEVIRVEEEKPDQEPAMISEEEIRKLAATWEVWDAFLVHMVSSLSGEPLTIDERRILMSTLLEIRHRFVSELSDETLGRDLVREQFVAAWKEVSTIFRNHLARDPSRSILSYLAFFAASDTLVALDRIGPGLGIEVSRDGLVRLASLISEGIPVTLEYRHGVDLRLREILGVGPPLPITRPAYEGEWIDLERDQEGTEVNISLIPTILRSYFPCAWAETEVPEAWSEDVRAWLVPEGDKKPYLEKVKALVMQAAIRSFEKEKNQDRYYRMFTHSALATAWQESCFRQFQVKENRVTYISSYNGTSVGIMQINERVWRGLYDERYLRWDIEYNAMAGGEILALYFRQYVLSRMNETVPEFTRDDVGLARLLYALYCGGPEELHKFLERTKTGRYYASDKLFFEKYTWVEGDQWEEIKGCL